MATAGASGSESGSTRVGLHGLRLAVISTPRSGNTWVRMQLAALYGLEQISVHDPAEIAWDNLPGRSVIQIHWWPVDDFLERLAQNGVRVVVLARHPLDVLISWLNLAYYKHQDGRCPGGGACTECGIAGVAPTSQAFLDYARSDYCRLLLCHTPAWWDRPGIIRARYEDFVADPEAELGRLATELGAPTVRPVAEVAAEHSIGRLRTHAEVWRFQCWQGQSGLWRSLLLAPVARAVRENVPEAFDWLGYACDPDEALAPREAELNWSRLQLDSAREHLARACERQARAEGSAVASRAALERVREELGAEQRAHELTREALAAAERRQPRLMFGRRDGPNPLPRPLGLLRRYLLPARARLLVKAADESSRSAGKQ